MHKHTQLVRTQACVEVIAGVYDRRGQREADNEHCGAVWWAQLKVNSTAGVDIVITDAAWSDMRGRDRR